MLLEKIYNNDVACAMVILTIVPLIFFPGLLGVAGTIALAYNALGVVTFIYEYRK